MMTTKPHAGDESLSLTMARRIDAVRDDFEAALRSGGGPRIEEFLSRLNQADRPHALAELLMLECEYRRSGGDPPTADEYRTRFPHDADLIDSTFGQFLPDETAAAVERPPDGTGACHSREAVPLAEPASPAALLGDYELLEKIAAGGMGEVYKARQRRLGRIVAVKLIRAAQRAGGEDVERFSAEAAAAAGLQHPGIVAVHEVGEQDGVHFFSMEYIDGQSLAQRLAAGTFAPQAAAALVAAVADAVDFAHQRGVLHRDLKPSNILLDRKERPRVVDFGLAKRIEADSALTATGQILGTPSYMPPEQAAGRGNVDCRGDVYALGAVLYEMLAGRPPFRGATAWETIRQVVETDPVPPRVLSAAIPRDLETIVLKCLDKSPAGRYATAALLADDLRRFERGEPILARPLGPLRRTIRWCQRKPVVAGLAAAVVLVLVAGTSVSTWFALDARRARDDALASAARLRSERDRADAEADNARRHERQAAAERDRARTALAETRRAIDRYVETVRNAELLKEERFKPLLGELLSGALDHYQRYIEHHARDADDRAELGRSLTAVGSLSFIQGDIEHARRSFAEAIAVFAALDGGGVNSENGPVLGEAYKGLAVVELETGDLAAAADALDRGLEVFGRLAADQPQTTKHRNELARLRRMYGNLERRKGRLAAAADQYRRAVEIEEALITDESDSARAAGSAGAARRAAHRAELAYSLNLLALVQYDLGNSLDALASHDRAIHAIEAVLADSKARPATAMNRSILAEAYGGKARTLGKIGDGDEAAKAFRRAIELQRPLVAENPTVREYRDGLAANHLNLGAEQQRIGDFAAAAESYAAAIALSTQLVAENPTVGKYRENLAMSYTNLGVLHSARGRLGDAESTLTEAVELFESLAAESPHIADHRGDLARAYCNLGTVFVQQGDLATGAATFRKAVDVLERLLAEHPADAYRALLALNYHNLAVASRSAGERGDFAAYNAKATEIYDRLASANPTVANYRKGAAMCHYQIGIDQKVAGKLAEAALSLAKAVELYAVLAAEHPAHGEYRSGLAGGLLHLGDLHLQSRRLTTALAYFDRAVDAYAPLAGDRAAGGEHWFGLAASHRRRAAALRLLGETDRAADSLETSIEMLAALSAAFPAVDRYRAALSDARAELAELAKPAEVQRQRAESSPPAFR